MIIASTIGNVIWNDEMHSDRMVGMGMRIYPSRNVW